MTPRPIHHHYQDPLSLIWLTCAAQVGYSVVRTADAYASTDGKRTLLIAEDSALDADDSLAQMILHELCHALVEGEVGEAQQDWGLDNTSGRDTWREQACLRLQAYLAGSVGLRDFFAPTTDFRIKFWNQLADDPFYVEAVLGGRAERSCVAARKGAWRASLPRWQQPLQTALAASTVIALAMRQVQVSTQSHRVALTDVDLKSEEIKASETLPSLWAVTQTPAPRHPAGHAPLAHYFADHGCADCAWSFTSRGALRCQHAPAIKLDADAAACTRWEFVAELNCQTCGACCREAFDCVDVGMRESVVKLHPEMIVHSGNNLKLKRGDDRCAALVGGHGSDNPYSCTIYENRPRTCREFTRASDNCLQARRKLGLSL